MKNGFNVAVVNTFSDDEPLNEVLQAAVGLSDVHFYITGKKSKANPEIMAQASGNVHFTDFLPDDQYYALLNTSNAIMCLTTRDHTMQRGACEALSLGKPIITSDWPILREYFREGAVHVPNNGDGIRQGVEEIKNHYEHYQTGIHDLQASQRREWECKVEELSRLVKQGMRGIE